MARKVFFSFHFQRDSWRVGQVRNSNVFNSSYEKSTYLDKAAWEEIQQRGKKAIRAWIDANMKGTSVTVVLIGAETNDREWVHYEIQRSWENGKGLVGIKIHKVKDRLGKTDHEGENPFRYYYVDENRELSKRKVGEDEWFGLGIFPPKGKALMTDYVKVYDWESDDGRKNIGKWIESAAKQVDR